MRVDRRWRERGRPVVVTDVLAFSQAENRERRRQRLSVCLDGRFSLAEEVGAVCGPLAARVAALQPPVWRAGVLEVMGAVLEVASTVVVWQAEVDGRRLTEHLADNPGARTQAISRIKDLAQRPQMPVLTDEGLASGLWVADLVAAVEPASVTLAALLKNSYQPNAPELRGRDSRSQKTEVLLRDHLDAAASALSRRLAVAESSRPAVSAEVDARAELAALGVVLP